MIKHSISRPLRIVCTHGSAAPPAASLPPRNTTRWVASRKAQVVAAVVSGQITIEEAMARYSLSLEEFAAWQRAFDRGGVKALRMGAIAREPAARRQAAERLEELTPH